jgi:hypothetical protein
MYLDKIHLFRTGVSLEISTSPIRSLMADAMEGEHFREFVQIKQPEDIHPYLFVTVHQGADALMKRRSRWVSEIRSDILAGKPVAFDRFARLFWRDIDEEDPDGDEWHRLFASAAFSAELLALLDKIRIAQRALRHSNDVLIRMGWDFLNGVAKSENRPAV